MANQHAAALALFRQGGHPVGECTRCGRRVRLYVPRNGDGSILCTYWHKAQNRSRWCRSEVQDDIDWGGA